MSNNLEIPEDTQLEVWRSMADELLRMNSKTLNFQTLREAAFQLQNAYLFGRQARAALAATAAPAVPEGLIDYLKHMRNECRKGFMVNVPEAVEQANKIEQWINALAAPTPAAQVLDGWTADEIGDACAAAEIPDSKYESLLMELMRIKAAALNPPRSNHG